jgi:acyl-CoA synthetase (AMP-forming)/AMP-acid ligase II
MKSRSWGVEKAVTSDFLLVRSRDTDAQTERCSDCRVERGVALAVGSAAEAATLMAPEMDGSAALSLPSGGWISLETGCLPAEMDALPATVAEALAARAGVPDDPWIIGSDFRLTFGEADALSAAMAGRLLAAGVGKGTRLGILFPNTPAWVVAWLAAARIGALTVPLSTFSPGRELARLVRHADVAAVLSAASFAGEDLAHRWEAGFSGLACSAPRLQLSEAPYLRWIHVAGERPPRWATPLPEPFAPSLVAAALEQVGPADALVVVSTSGVTSEPKAVVHTHGSLIRHAAEIARLRGLDGTDRIYSPMPFFWVGGLTTVLLYSLTSGAAAVVQQRFEPAEALELMERERVTFVACWPNAARALASHPTFSERDLDSVRGGTLIEALPVALRPTSVDRNPMQLGMTETGGPHTNPDDTYLPLPEQLRGTFGRCLPGVEHVVVDAESGRVLPAGELGELLVRGPFLMDQLYKVERRHAFTPDGWYRTGDLCSIDESGYLRYAGRRTAMIKTAGSNVSPAEVEAVLKEVAGVSGAYVVGLPAGPRGQDVAAVVVSPNDAKLSVADLDAHARGALSTFKVPRHWAVLAEADVPMTATGKPDLRAMTTLLERGRSVQADGMTTIREPE